MDQHSRTLDKPNKYIVAIILVVSLVGIFYVFNRPVGSDIIRGMVTKVESEKDITLEVGEKTKTIKEQTLSVEINTGGEKRSITILNDYNPVREGDGIFLRGALFGDDEFTIADVSRTRALVLVLVFFVALVLIIGGMKGVY